MKDTVKEGWKEELQAIIWQVEKCGASPDLTKAVIMLGDFKGKVSQVISEAILKREKELVEEIEKILPKDWVEKAEKAKKEGNVYSAAFYIGMFDTVEKVLSIISKK